MAMYVMLTKLTEDAIKEPRSFEQLGQAVIERLKRECPEARWVGSYSVLGPYDYVDIFEAPDNEAAAKVALIVRSFGHATTEIWPATPWERFKAILRSTVEGVQKEAA